MSWLKDIVIWIFRARSVSDIKLLQEVYKTAIEDLQRQLAETKASIKQHRERHPDNGVELDEWEQREEKLHKMIVSLLQENRDLKEELIFLKRMKKRSMYE